MYSYEEALKECKDYFNGEELPTSVFLGKYALRDNEGNLLEKTPNDSHKRLAKEFARIESKKFKNPLTEEEIYQLFYKFSHLIPQGSPYAAVGNDHQFLSSSNCFVLDSPKDSYGGILKSDEELVQISKRRGGIGIDLSNLRPTGSTTLNSSRTSTGIKSWMERYSHSIREVGQGGRRGALMLSISVHHPDVMTFIKAKNNDKDVTGANISVRVTNEFLEAVKKNKEYELRFPVDSKKPKISQKVSAKEVWNAIVENAHSRAEPGVLFWDNIVNESPADCYSEEGFTTISTNPCFTKDSLILLESGYHKFEDLLGLDDNTILSDNRITNTENDNPEEWIINNDLSGVNTKIASNTFLTGIDKDVVEIVTNDGFSLKCTPDHHIATKNGMKEAQHLNLDDEILISNPKCPCSIVEKLPKNDYEEMSLLMGLIAGDGTFDKNRNRVHIDFWGDEKEKFKNIVCSLIDSLYRKYGDVTNFKNKKLSKYFISENKNQDKVRISSSWLAELLNRIFNFNKNTKLIIPKTLMQNARSSMSLFYIAGLMYADGSIQGSKKSGYTIRLVQSNKELLKQVQLILQANNMLFSLKKRRDGQNRNLPDGKGGIKSYFCKTQYELISVSGAIVGYRDNIGFLGSYKEQKLESIDHKFVVKNSYYSRFSELNYIGKENVYCIKEDVGKNIIVNGLSVRRCGEIPLCAYDSCRLLAINTFSCVENPYTKKAKFNYDKFFDLSRKGQRLLDDLIDLEIEKINEIITKIESDPESDKIKSTEIELWNQIKTICQNGRRTGLGITVLGDTLAACNVKYGSKKSIDFVDKIYKTMKFGSYTESVEMSKELGSFPIWDWQKERKNSFINRIKDEVLELESQTIDGKKLVNDIRKYGRRNIANLTTAPTGSISILAGIKIMDDWYHYTSSGIEPVYLLESIRKKKGNPGDDNFRTDSIDSLGDHWMHFVEYHKPLQAWMNINEKTEIDDSCPYVGCTAPEINWVQRVKLQAAAQKHVDHSISSTVNLPNDVSIEEVDKIYKAAWDHGCKGMTIYRDGCRSGVLVSIDSEKQQDINISYRPKSLPCDIYNISVNKEKFTVLVGLNGGKPYEVFCIDGWIEKSKLGEIVKIRKSTYMLKTDKHEIKLSEFLDNDDHNAIMRLISTVLRCGGDIQFVVEQLKKTNGPMTSMSKSIARALKNYINDGQESGENCPECDAKLVYQEGCLSCKCCGFSKCG